MQQETQHRPQKHPTALAVKGFWSAALLLLAASAVVHIHFGFTGDREWLLAAAGMLLDGKRLYVDVFEINPPLILWIYTPAAFLAHHLGGLKDYWAHVSLGLVVAGGCLFACLRIIRSHPLFEDNPPKQRLFVLLLAFVFIFWTNLPYFFDREHIFFMLTLPYVLRYMPSLARVTFPRPLRVVIGCLAGIGFCIKPHCLVVLAGIYFLTVLRERRFFIVWSLESCLIYAAIALYLLAIWQLTPEYFAVVLPMALATYSGYTMPRNKIFYGCAVALTFGMSFADFRLRDRSPYRRDILYLLSLCVFYLLYAFANNGWGYTFQPTLDMLLFLNGWVLWEQLYLRRMQPGNPKNAKRHAFGIRACALNIIIYIGITFIYGYLAFTAECNATAGCRQQEQFTRIMRETNAHSFGALAINFSPWPTLMRESDARLETRFNHLWMMPRFAVADPAFSASHAWVVAYVANGFAYDLTTRRPTIVFVDTSPHFFTTGHPLDIVALLSAYPAFREAWAHYRLIRVLDYCIVSGPKENLSSCRYSVYQRYEGIRLR